jgi:hypothetical protein
MDRHLDKLVTRVCFDGELAGINRRFDTIERSLQKLGDVPGVLRLHTWMLAPVTVTLVVPTLQEWFGP